jgi:transaldolase
MKFFIDTADINEIKEAQSWGLLDGVTTNPSLIARTGRTFDEVIREIVQVVDGPISAEVVSTDHEGMVAEAKELVKIHENIVVKIPLTMDGLKTTRWCRDNNIQTNVTLCFSPLQALMAAKAGADYISPFIGRLDDIGHDGMELISQIVEIYRNYDFDTEVLVASVRHPMHVLESARLGADVVTVPFDVLSKLARHPLTDSGLAKFLADWEKVPKA